MTKPKLNPGSPKGRKKNSIPLSNLRTADVVRTVVDHPRRLEELVAMLHDKDWSVRGRAAATLARLSDSYPARLVGSIARLKDALGDESAYVRWHLLYTLGQVISRFPSRASTVLGDLRVRLGDEDRVVRSFAVRALESVAARQPRLVHELFAAGKEEMPPALAAILQERLQKSGRS